MKGDTSIFIRARVISVSSFPSFQQAMHVVWSPRLQQFTSIDSCTLCFEDHHWPFIIGIAMSNMEHYNCYPPLSQSRWPLDTIAEVRSPTISQFGESFQTGYPARNSSLSKEAFPFLEQDPYESMQVVQNGLHYAGTWSNASSRDSLALPEARSQSSPRRHRHNRSISTSSSACLPHCGSFGSGKRSRSTSSSRVETPPRSRVKSWRTSMLLDPDSGATYRRRLSRTLNRILDLEFAIPDIDSQLIQDVLQTLRDLDLEREERCEDYAGECYQSCPYCCEPFENNLCPYGCATSHVFYEEDDYTQFRREGRKCHDSISSNRCMTDIPCQRTRPTISRSTSKESVTSNPCNRSGIPRCGSNHSLCGSHSRPSSKGHSRDNSSSMSYTSKSSSFSRPFVHQQQQQQQQQQQHQQQYQQMMQRTPPVTPPRWQQHRRHWNSNSGHNRLPSIQTVSTFSLPTPSSSISMSRPHRHSRSRTKSHSFEDDDAWTDSEGEFDFDVSDYEVCEVEPVRFVSPRKSPTIRHVRRGREMTTHKTKRMSKKMITRESLYFGQAL